MASFDITTARGMLAKLDEEAADFAASHHLSPRHAINAAMTAYHLYEWVWGSFAKTRSDLHSVWNLASFNAKKPRDAFLRYLFTQCPALEDAQKITNGSKHFGSSIINTGKHLGNFQAGAFQDNAFDVSYLWLDRPNGRQNAKEFINELVIFWHKFFDGHGVP